MAAVKPTPSDRILPDGWQRVRLGEHLALCRNGLVSRQDANPENAVPITRIETIADGKIDWTRVGYVPLEDADQGYLVQMGDILLSHINSVKHIGKVARVSDDALLLHGMNLMLLRFRESMDFGFGYALMSSANTKLYMERRAKKAVNQASINRQDIFELPILLPPLPEQRAIAAVLDSIDEAIEGVEAVIAATEQLRDSLLQDLLTRGLPGQHTEFRDVPGLGTIPADWEVVRLGDVVPKFEYGTSVKCSSKPRGIPILRIPNIASGQLNLRDLKYADLTPKESASVQLEAGDILLVRTNGNPDICGQCWVSDGLDGAWGYASYLVRGRADRTVVNPWFVGHFLKSEVGRRLLKSNIRTSAGNYNLSVGGLGSMPLPCPLLNEQDLIVDTIRSLSLSVEVARQELAGLRLLKESTADALLTGRVRIGGKNE